MPGRSTSRAASPMHRLLGLTLVMTPLLVGCTPKAARVEFARRLPSSEPRVFLVAAQQKERIAESLQEAGFELADDLLDAPYLLRVTLGNEKDFRACGTLSNVKYSLRHEGRSVVDLTAAGWSGTCKPNVFDEMSERLIRRFESSGGRT